MRSGYALRVTDYASRGVTRHAPTRRVVRYHPAMPTRSLTRSRRHRMLFGVCGGIADWLGWDPTLVRVLYVLVSVVSAAFPGILVYLILWVVMPEE